MNPFAAVIATILLNLSGLLAFQYWGRYAIDTLVDMNVDTGPCLSRPVQREACDLVMRQFVLWNGVGFLLFTFLTALGVAWVVTHFLMRRGLDAVERGNALRNYAALLLVPLGATLIAGNGDWLGLAAMVTGTLAGGGLSLWRHNRRQLIAAP